MSDVEGSSEYWASGHHEMTSAVRDLDAVVSEVSEAHGGAVLKSRGEGDSHFVVFERPSAAVAAACELQLATKERRLGGRSSCEFASASTLAKRIRPRTIYGIAVNQTARLRGVAYGGQTVVSSVVAALARAALSSDVQLRSLGHHRLRDFPELEEIFQAAIPGVEEVFPPLRTGASRSPGMMAIAIVDVCNSKGRYRGQRQRRRHQMAATAHHRCAPRG